MREPRFVQSTKRNRKYAITNYGPCAVPNCGKDAKVSGMCMSHYRRFKKHGDVNLGGTSPGEPSRWINDHKGHLGDHCLPWPFGNGSGYASVFIDGRYSKAHRVMCAVANGPPPNPSDEARHLCGNNRCVNPRHLAWGSPKQNASDRRKHGTIIEGEKVKGSRLSEADVLRIRARFASGETCAAIAKDFPVGKSNIWSVVKGKTWSHI